MIAPGREVTVHVPGLLGPWPRALVAEVARGLALPGLVGLLARARRSGRVPRRGGAAPESFERLAFNAFGYPPGEADVPAAELMQERDAVRLRPARTARARADANETTPISLRADPVHVRPDLDTARLFDASFLDLFGEEAAAMAGALDRHFAAEGLRFEAPLPTRWYVHVPERADAVFHPPGSAVGRGVGGLLPGGTDGSLWRRRMNEAQMVLHAHPCNEARASRGDLPVNSVWFWGAGTLADVPRSRFEEVRADDPLLRALAERGGVRARGLEENAGLGAESLRTVLVAPGIGFYRAVVGRDVEGWRRELLGAEERWFRPLHEGMRDGRVRTVAIDAGLRSGLAVFEARARWWRRPSVSASAPELAEFLLAEGARDG
ncbi:MAG: hypothetical protein OXC01_07590 [Immundisolibacterales bacterium]|nr:hypothetical protein [Immundisolibacterales bacterium]